MTRPALCAIAECNNPAAAAVHAEWSVVDFIDYPSCEVHTPRIWKALAARRVDGITPVDIWVQWSEPAADHAIQRPLPGMP